MGIAHFMPVGRSPGAVTTALSYIIENPAFRAPYAGGACQDLVIFCSRDVWEGSTPTEEYHWNEYGKTHPRKGWIRPRRPPALREVLREFLDKEGIRARMREDGGQLYFWPLDDVEDFEGCLRAVATATLALGRARGVGRLLWANLTGGTNVLNAAILEAAFLSGLFGKVYYSFLRSSADRAYLQPISKAEDQFGLRPLPLFKSRLDDRYYRVLRCLETLGDWCVDTDVLEQLRQDEHGRPEEEHYFKRMDIQDLRTQLLNRMDGREIERKELTKQVGGREVIDKTHEMRLAPAGAEALARLEDPLFSALIDRGQGITESLFEECRARLAECRDDEEAEET